MLANGYGKTLFSLKPTKTKDLKKNKNHIIGNKMKQLNPFLELDEIIPDFEFDAYVLEKNNREADLLIKKGYKIKKSVWNGLIAS